MSASEKLKALEDADGATLRNFLPFLVAVAREAEFYLQEYTAGRPALTLGIEQSLAALEEALS